jgi:lipooligosaccharide transport system ATP-binding protein
VGYVLEARNITKKFQNKLILDSINLQLKNNECLGIVGPNQSGKTTLLKILSCQLPYDTGELFYADAEFKKYSVKSRKYIGFCPEEENFDWSYSPETNLIAYACLFGMEREKARLKIQKLCRELGIYALNDKLNFGEIKIDQLRKLSLCQSLINDPKLWIIDNPTRNLEEKESLEIWQHMSHFKKTAGAVLFATDLLEEAERVSDRVIMLSNGKIIAQGAPSQILKEEIGSEVVEFKINKGDINYYLEKIKGNYEYKITNEEVRLFLKKGQNSIEAVKLMARDNIQIRRPSLEDLFIKKTNHKFRGVEL